MIDWQNDENNIDIIKDEIKIIAIHEADYYVGDNRKYKRYLLELLWLLEDSLDNCNQYANEEEWYTEREQVKMLKKLSGENTYDKT